MQMYPEKFYGHRRQDPLRRAEARIFDALKRCGRPGFACYEWQRDRRSPQLDFALWLVNVGRFGLQVKGGNYRLLQGEWQRWDRGGRGRQVSTCPLAVTSDATMSLLKELTQALDRSVFVIPVLIFPDMDPEPAISKRAQRSNVHLIWKTDPLLERLSRIAREVGVFRPPNREDVGREVAVITDGQVRYMEPLNPGDMENRARPAPDRRSSTSHDGPPMRFPGIEVRGMDRLVIQPETQSRPGRQ